MPVYWPSTLVPMVLASWSAAMACGSAPAPSATRTTTITGRVWSAMASRLLRSVPLVPALLMAWSMRVNSTGVSSGKAASSASDAVATRPMTAVEMMRIGRRPSLTSTTRTPWW